MSDSQITGTFIGASHKVRKLLDLVQKVAGGEYPVLISGESGTGKELVARLIHDLGPRRNGPFIPIDCGSISTSLIESELFGHVRGAFTGAVETRLGLIRAATGGTAFLDEVAELPQDAQPKLLRLLQERTVRPVGGVVDLKVNVRILAATNRDLHQEVLRKRFRHDLFYRLNVVWLTIPPLRQRRWDIPLLVEHFLRKYAPGQERRIAESSLEKMLAYDWPGNVRELENAILSALALCPGDEELQIQSLPSHPQVELPPSDRPLDPASELDLTLKEMELRAVCAAVQRAGGDKRRAAQLLGIGKTTLYRKLKDAGGLL